jgi:chitinase
MLKINEMDQFLDFWNIMAYDFAGGWGQTTGHLANLYSSTQNPESTKVSADTAIDYYVSQGVRKDKLVLGMPVYGRAFLNTDGPGKPYSGIAPSGWEWSMGNWEAGVWDYKALPLSGAKEIELFDIVASYSYDEAQRIMISYDTKGIAARKAQYIKESGLGGAMFWETSGDKPGNDSLIGSVSLLLQVNYLANIAF